MHWNCKKKRRDYRNSGRWMGFQWHYGHVVWVNGSQPNFDNILKQLSLSIASRRHLSLTFMLRFINFVVIKDVIFTEKSLTLVVGTRTFLSQMCPFMFRFECMRLRGWPKSSTRSVKRHFCQMLNTYYYFFGRICFPPYPFFFSFRLFRELWAMS